MKNQVSCTASHNLSKSLRREIERTAKRGPTPEQVARFACFKQEVTK